MPAGFVEPHQRGGQVDERHAVHARDLHHRQGPISDGLLPCGGNVAPATDLRTPARAGMIGFGEIETHHLIVVVARRRSRCGASSGDQLGG